MMWPWTDPLKEMLRTFLNRICAPYIENFDSGRFNDGITSGELQLNDLRLKNIKLEKCPLPVVISEGYLGRLTIFIPWKNLRSKPVEIVVTDIYILVTPSSVPQVDSEDEERRARAVKSKRLEALEFSKTRIETGKALEKQGFIASLIMKLVKNLQITVKNVHIRYEDDLDRPGHPFAAGVSLAALTATSVDPSWQSAFVQSSTGPIHKLVSLRSLAVYLDTDSHGTCGLPTRDVINKLTSPISSNDRKSGHQFILRPVTTEGRFTINRPKHKATLDIGMQLLFQEVGVMLDDHQYGAIISLIDRYHLYLRRYQYRHDAPNQSSLDENRARALLRFAARAILREIHAKNRKNTFTYMKEVGEKRRLYMTLFRKRLLLRMMPEDKTAIEVLEGDLSYEDIRLYRFLTRIQIRKDIKAGELPKTQKLEVTRSGGAATPRSWSLDKLLSSVIRRSFSGDNPRRAEQISNENLWNLTDEQLKVLYEAVDYNPGAVTHMSIPNADFAVTLKRGILTLKNRPHGMREMDVISLVLDELKADIIRHADILLTLGGLRVFDGTTGSAYPQIIGVKGSCTGRDSAAAEGFFGGGSGDDNDPVLYIKFEKKSSSQKPDASLTVRLRCMEVIYHKGYIEGIYQFFRPPQISQTAFETFSGVASSVFGRPWRKASGKFEYVMTTHDTLDLEVDLQAPIIILPENIASKQNQHLVLYAGHITIKSDFAAENAEQESAQGLHYDSNRFETHPYQRFSLNSQGAQFLLGPDLASCLSAIEYPDTQDTLHIIERIDLELSMQKFMASNTTARHVDVSRLPRIHVSARLPRLQVNMSDTNYKTIKRFIISSIPTFKEPNTHSGTRTSPPAPCNSPSSCFAPNFGSCCRGDGDYDTADDGCIDFAETGVPMANSLQQAFSLDFALDNFQAFISKCNRQGVEKLIGKMHLEGFKLISAVDAFTWIINVSLRSLTMDLEQVSNDRIVLLSSSHDDSIPEKDLKTVADTLWDAVKTTFVSEDSSSSPPSFFDSIEYQTIRPKSPKKASLWSDKIRVTVDPASVEVALVNNSAPLATMTLSTANVSVTISGKTMRIDIIQMFLMWSVAYYWQVLGRILAEAPAI